jgi:hypothetical protein
LWFALLTHRRRGNQHEHGGDHPETVHAWRPRPATTTSQRAESKRDSRQHTSDPSTPHVSGCVLSRRRDHTIRNDSTGSRAACQAPPSTCLSTVVAASRCGTWFCGLGSRKRRPGVFLQPSQDDGIGLEILDKGNVVLRGSGDEFPEKPILFAGEPRRLR